MKENFTAVDIVIVPPKEVQDLAIGLSSKIRGSNYVLGINDYIPHISLYMGYSKDIETTRKEIEESVRSESKLNLTLEGPVFSEGTILTLALNKSLRSLHYRLLGSVFLSHQGRHENAYFDTVRERSLAYLTKFVTLHARKNYHPHITLGNGVLGDYQINLPLDFEADTIALFHLGNYNTCRRLIGKWQLGG